MSKLLKAFYFIFLTFQVSAFEIPEDIRQGIENLHKHCKEKTGVAMEHIHKCSDKELPADPDAKCYIGCFHENSDVNLDTRIVLIQNVEHALNDDIHRVVEKIRNECDDAYFGKFACIFFESFLSTEKF